MASPYNTVTSDPAGHPLNNSVSVPNEHDGDGHTVPHYIDDGRPETSFLSALIREVDFQSSWDLTNYEAIFHFALAFLVTSALFTASKFGLDWRVIVPLVYGVASAVPRLSALLRDSRVTVSPVATMALLFCQRMSIGEALSITVAQLAGAFAGVALALPTVAGKDFADFKEHISQEPKGDLVAVLVGGSLILTMDALNHLHRSYQSRLLSEMHDVASKKEDKEVIVYMTGLRASMSAHLIGGILFTIVLSFAGINAFSAIINPYVFFALTVFVGPGSSVGWSLLSAFIAAVMTSILISIFVFAYNIVGPVRPRRVFSAELNHPYVAQSAYQGPLRPQ